MQSNGAPPPPPPLPPKPPPPPHGGVYAAQPERPNDGIPYIGSRISLISKTDIRYEGYLFNIDTRQSMVALQQVRSFGTEGRRVDHISPAEQVLPFATFKASEIKDLHVCEAAPPMYGYAPPPPIPPMPMPPQPRPMAPPMPPQPPMAAPMPQMPPQPPVQPPLPKSPEVAPKLPSPMSKPVSQKMAATAPGPTLLTPGSMAAQAGSPPPRRVAPEPQVAVPKPVEQQPTTTQAAAASSNVAGQAASRGRTIPGMGDHLLRRRERRVPGGDPSSVATGEDYDIEAHLHAFNKEEEFSKLSLNENKTTQGSYQKSSFFDTISCDALDRLEGKHGRVTASEERKLNTETFGAVGFNNRRSFRGGRGGRGGRRGGHRGSSGRGGGGGGHWYRNGSGRRDGNPAQT